MDIADDGESGWFMGDTEPYDAAVLDLGLPKLDGLSVLQRWRQSGNQVPVLILTSRDTWREKVVGLRAGADDYLVKPFALQELYARIRALHKRSRAKISEILAVGDLRMDKRTLEVERSGQKISLNPACLKILQRLMEASPAVVVHSDFENLLWGDDQRDSDALRSHFYKLRCAIDRPFDSRLIHTVHRIGYRLADLRDDDST